MCEPNQLSAQLLNKVLILSAGNYSTIILNMYSISAHI
jgi:hypothetical protein